MKRTVMIVLSLVISLSMVLAACGSPTPATVQQPVVQTVVVKETQQVEVTKEVQVTQVVQETAVPQKDRVQIYWYIGLGAGSQPAQIPAEKAFADKFNASQKDIQLIPIIVDNKYARDNLTAQIAAGNAPDIVGPVGTAGRAAFPGAWADLTPLIKEANYDTSDIDPAFLQFYQAEGALQGLPFAIYPESVYVNKDLFKEAGLELPPQKYGDKYTLDGKQVEWNFDTLTEVAKRLTVDKSGNDATAANFDRNNIVQYGYIAQWTDGGRAMGTLFGASLPFDNGKAVISDNWKAAWKWYYEGIWGKSPFIPTAAVVNGDLMKGNAFSSGKVAMATTHTWYTCCIDPKVVPNWDLAVMPSYNGKITAKMHGDTFAILSASKHPKEAFQVYMYMLNEGAKDLYAIYGGLPAKKADQADYLKSLDEKFAPNKVNWQVALDSIQYMDVPNHELYIPNYSKAMDLFTSLTSDIEGNDKLDMDKRIEQLTSDLQKVYDEVGGK